MEKQLQIKMPYTNGLTKAQAEVLYEERKKNKFIQNIFLCERKTATGSIEHFVSIIVSKEFIEKHYKNITIIK